MIETIFGSISSGYGSNTGIWIEEFTLNFFKINSFPLKITINIVNDEEEKMMSLFFGEYNEIQVLPVNKMKIIYNIINEGMSIKNPLEIYKILNEAKWNIQKCIEELL